MLDLRVLQGLGSKRLDSVVPGWAASNGVFSSISMLPLSIPIMTYMSLEDGVEQGTTGSVAGAMTVMFAAISSRTPSPMSKPFSVRQGLSSE